MRSFEGLDFFDSRASGLNHLCGGSFEYLRSLFVLIYGTRVSHVDTAGRSVQHAAMTIQNSLTTGRVEHRNNTE